MAAATLALVGAYAGQTVTLNLGLTEYNFTDGEITLTGSDADVAALSRCLALNFQALPKGSPEWEAKVKELEHGGEVHTDGVLTNGETNLQGGAGPDTTLNPNPDNGGGAGEATTGGAGAGDATGDGSRSIVEALTKLDPADDAHWNADGKPKMTALEAILGRTDVTRAQVEAAAPGFTRPKVG